MAMAATGLRTATTTSFLTTLCLRRRVSVSRSPTMSAIVRSFSTSQHHHLHRSPWLSRLSSSTTSPFTRSVLSSPSSITARCLNTQAPPEKDVLIEPLQMTGVRKGWFGKEDDRALYFRIDMPGLSQESITIAFDNNTNNLIIQGNGGIRTDDTYKATLHIPPNVFNTDEINSEMKNGVLKVIIPKLDNMEPGKKFVEFNIPNTNLNPFFQGPRVRKEWRVDPNTGDFLMVWIDMPGVPHGNVDAYGDGDACVVEAFGEEESEYEGGATRVFTCRIDVTNYNKSTRIFSVEDGACMVGFSPLPVMSIPPNPSRLNALLNQPK